MVLAGRLDRGSCRQSDHAQSSRRRTAQAVTASSGDAHGSPRAAIRHDSEVDSQPRTPGAPRSDERRQRPGSGSGGRSGPRKTDQGCVSHQPSASHAHEIRSNGARRSDHARDRDRHGHDTDSRARAARPAGISRPTPDSGSSGRPRCTSRSGRKRPRAPRRRTSQTATRRGQRQAAADDSERGPRRSRAPAFGLGRGDEQHRGRRHGLQRDQARRRSPALRSRPRLAGRTEERSWRTKAADDAAAARTIRSAPPPSASRMRGDPDQRTRGSGSTPTPAKAGVPSSRSTMKHRRRR